MNCPDPRFAQNICTANDSLQYFAMKKLSIWQVWKEYCLLCVP